MVAMAQGMKEYANNFKSQFQEDAKLIDRISSVQDDNLKRTDTEIDKIAGQRRAVTTGFFTRIIMLFVALGVFAFMVMFIRMWPHKTFRYINV